MSGPDGLEERTFDTDEHFREAEIGLDLEAVEFDELDRIPSSMRGPIAEMHQSIASLSRTALVIREQRDDLKAVLRDIILGCNLMLEPPLLVEGAMRKFIEEIKRIATAGVTL
jgi:hypothetical protein